MYRILEKTHILPIMVLIPMYLLSIAVINFVTKDDEDLARAVRACEDSTDSDGYQATFSRNRMFRKRVKNNALPLADKL